MNQKTDLFLQYFSRLENKLREITNPNGFVNIRSMLKIAYKKDKYLYHKKELIDDICNLRNVLVHEYGNKIIAIPTDEALNELMKIVNYLEAPPKVYDLFKDERVFIAKFNSTLYECLVIMRDRDYSQLPIYKGKHFIGMLTGNVIANWIQKHLSLVDMRLNELLKITVNKVLEYEEVIDEAVFLSRTTTLYDFIDVSANQPSPSGIYLITEHGKSDQHPIAIITPYDNKIIYKELDLL
jgi:predicted transcriptional regulator